MTGAADRISAAGLLDAAQMELIHQEALIALEKHGVEINHPGVLSRLADAGCQVDFESGMTTFPEELIANGLAAAPREISPGRMHDCTAGMSCSAVRSWRT